MVNWWGDAPYLDFHVYYVIFGSIILLYSLTGYVLKKYFLLTDIVVGTVLGIILGPAVADIIIDPFQWYHWEYIVFEIVRIVLAIQLTAAAYTLSERIFWECGRTLFILLVPVMILMWATSSALTYAVFNDRLSIWECVLIGACITPTDPVVAGSIMRGRFAEEYVPEMVRHVISAESGTNDGLAYPFVLLPILFTAHQSHATAGTLLGTKVLLYDVIVIGILFGAVCGFLTQVTLKLCERLGIIDKIPYFSIAISLAFIVLGLARILGGDGMNFALAGLTMSELLAVFSAGLVFTSGENSKDKLEEEHFMESFDTIIVIICFVLIATIFPWHAWNQIGYGKLAAWGVAIVFVRRLPWVLLFGKWMPSLPRKRDVVFTGWFGPVGVTAVYYALFAYQEEETLLVFDYVMWPVMISVFVFGGTANLGAIMLNFSLRGTLEKVLELPWANRGDVIHHGEL